jgi:RND superfamily putative drug exporter
MKRRPTPTGIGRWSTRHPWIALGVWLGFVGAAVAVGLATGSKQLQSGTAGESLRAQDLINQHQAWPNWPEFAYLHSDTLRSDDPTFRRAIDAVKQQVSAALGSPVAIATASGGHSVLVGADPRRPFSTENLRAAVAAAGTPAVIAVLDDNSGGGGGDLSRAERLSVPVTLLVLLIAFGALVAALVPLLLGVTAVIATFGLLGPISQVFPLDDSVKTVVLLIGMAVGVDYALFYVIRSREERHAGLPSHAALERTARTSGRTVIIAGTTVCIAMAGQFAVGLDVFNGIAAGTITVIACAVVGSITVLPAVLELLGPRIDRGRIRFLPHLASGGESRFWPAVVDRVLRRPLACLIGATALLVALALPALGLHVALPSGDALAPRLDRPLQQRITADFPGASVPAVVVFTYPAGSWPAVAKAAQRLEALAATDGITHSPFGLARSGDGRAGTLTLPLTGLGDNRASRDALAALRSALIPQTLGRVAGVDVAVTGDTADDVDFTHQIRQALPYVIGFVLVLAFLLLLVTFRSIVVPIKAITLNLLSVAASYGVLVLVFQHAWAQGVLGFQSIGAIVSWLPVFLFVVLFGLSMDYHIFILSRVREAIDDGQTNEQALRYGITRTAGVVTSAALVMFGVFSLFATASALDLKQAGVGLAVAVLLDATVVRAVLLPASMQLLGDRNWYLPRWLDWLPRIGHHEPAPAPDSAAPPMPALSREA